MILPTAKLDWLDGQPRSRAYDDIYFSRDGDAEVMRVFVEPSDLPGRAAEGEQLTVAELGFGSGRNFLCTAAVAAKRGCRLHFISVEQHPLRRDDLERALKGTAHVELAAELAAHHPPPISGWHRRVFNQGRTVLSLYLGDVHEFVDDLKGRHPHGVDAWFLDGFAPGKNPDMWSDGVLRAIGETARPGCSVATFTAAGRVRRALELAGFDMRRVDQRPHKRESLAGRLGLNRDLQAPAPPSAVHIAGAGIAGCSLAAHLAGSGIDVVLSDIAEAPATGASSVIAMQHGRLLGDGSAQADWRAAAYLYATHWNADRPEAVRTGAEQHPGPNMDEAKLRRIAAAYEGSGDWLQLLEDKPALWFPDAAVVDLPELCTALANHPRIEKQFGKRIETDLPTVFACGAASIELPACEGMPIRSIWGQIDRVRINRVTTAPLPNHAMIGNGYLAPLGEDLVAGSTYEYTPWEIDEATRTNLARLPGKSVEWLERRRGARTVASDRTPVVGYHKGVWLSTAHGSMGATSAHLSAALITHKLLGWIPPVDSHVEHLLRPSRFEERARKRQLRSGREPEAL